MYMHLIAQPLAIPGTMILLGTHTVATVAAGTESGGWSAL
jgi:hypothetical protein